MQPQTKKKYVITTESGLSGNCVQPENYWMSDKAKMTKKYFALGWKFWKVFYFKAKSSIEQHF